MASENPALQGPELSSGCLETTQARSDASGKILRNHILTSISDSEFGQLRPYLESVELTYHQNLFGNNGEVDHAYFLNRGMISLVVTTADGRSVEVGVVGKEGAVGTGLAVDLRKSPYRAIVQIPGEGVRIHSEQMARLGESTPGFELLLNRFASVQGMQVAQLAACNRLHEIEQRLARWILMCHDRTDSDLLPMTHEFFAQMLGAGRPSVTLAAGALQKAGIIRYTRGKVSILNRQALEAAACECYRVIRQYNGDTALPENSADPKAA
ncbi:MAG: Crp/Fnr family transcriptional regulator [Acidobacteria bacterium]|nr:Crp/Fnr family transcriptional regulator [Acidobacteriota bacterium]